MRTSLIREERMLDSSLTSTSVMLGIPGHETLIFLNSSKEKCAFVSPFTFQVCRKFRYLEGTNLCVSPAP